MSFYVIMVTFLATVSMNKLTNIVIPTYSQFIQMPITETKFGGIRILANLWWNILMVNWNLDEKPLGKWHYLQECEFRMPIFFYKEWQILLVYI